MIEMIKLIAFAVACVISTIHCEYLSADFDMSLNTPQVINLGFEPKKEEIADECKLADPPKWCPKTDNDLVKFSEFPEETKKFTYSADRVYKITVKRQNPATPKATVKFNCAEHHIVDQVVDAGFEILNAAQSCPGNQDLNNVINCKVDDAKKMKVTFGGTCKVGQVFTFTGVDGTKAAIEIKVEFTPVDTEAPVPVTTASTTVATVKTTVTKDTDHTNLQETGATNSIGTKTTVKENTTTSVGTMCKFSASFLTICLVLRVSF